MSDISSSYGKLGRHLVGLFAFHLVARSGNFTSAARTLGISQSAVSQRIKTLELELGVVLFTREHRGVALTNEGLRLLSVIQPAMDKMGASVNTLLERKSRPRVRISADFAFSTFWLLPRLYQLRSDLGDEIEIQILASQTAPDDSDDCDISIHVQSLSGMTSEDILLIEERVAAVCSPGFVEEHGAILEPSDLLEAQLLSLSKPPSAEWMTWQSWFDSLGITGERSRNLHSFNNYDMVAQGALAGHGVALGWLGLIDDLLESGKLVQVTDAIAVSDAGYILSQTQTSMSKGPDRVVEWIVDRINNTDDRDQLST